MGTYNYLGLWVVTISCTISLSRETMGLWVVSDFPMASVSLPCRDEASLSPAWAEGHRSFSFP